MPSAASLTTSPGGAGPRLHFHLPSILWRVDDALETINVVRHVSTREPVMLVTRPPRNATKYRGARAAARKPQPRQYTATAEATMQHRTVPSTSMQSSEVLALRFAHSPPPGALSSSLFAQSSITPRRERSTLAQAGPGRPLVEPSFERMNV